MPKRISLKPHLTVAELKIRYRTTKDPVERNRYQVVLLLLQGQSLQLVEELSGYCQQSIYKIVRCYNQGGVAALQDRRHRNIGASRNPLLNSEQEEALWRMLKSPPPGTKEWDGRMVSDWIGKQIGRSVSTQTGRRYLKKMRARLRPPCDRQCTRNQLQF